MDLDLDILPPGLKVGTSSFSTADWCGPFYPADLAPQDFLTNYALRLPTVEIDATWHYMPNPKIVSAWARKVPDTFVFSAKVPKVITHEKRLVGCEEDVEYFLETMGLLGPKLGPLVFQFQYISRTKDPQEHETGDDFVRRLEAFLPLLPEGRRYVVEIRNDRWLAGPLPALLRSRNIALALIDYATMPRAQRWLEILDPVTADFSYVRFLGDHHAMDNLVARKKASGRKSREWDELVVDRSREMQEWIPVLRRLTDRVSDVYVYFNNHYAGFAPGSIDLFLKTWRETES